MNTIWKTPPDIDQINKFSLRTATESLGIVFTEAGPDYLCAKMPVDQRTIQPAGLLHGGASVLLAESLGSVASIYCREDESTLPVGVEINANHIKPARSGFVKGTVRPIHIGRTIHVWEIKIENEKGQLCCISRLTVTMVRQVATTTAKT
jgi:1,4-dihydroxy-2-naphthoyl-CoA hydrolase